MNEIFISYKVHNRKTAIEYYKKLKDKDLNVWFDQLIPKGSNWDTMIKRHIKSASLVLCLISKESLIDDWVLNQIKYARKYKKQIIFLSLDDTPDKEFVRRYNLEYLYKNFDEINFNFNCSTNPYINYVETKKDIKGYFQSPYPIILIMSFLAIYMSCYGLNILNIYLRTDYGYLGAGVVGLFLISLIPNKIVSYINNALSLGLLIVAMYIIEPYYVSSISINPLVFMLFYFICFLYRNSNRNLAVTIISTLFYTMLFGALAASSMIFSEYILNFDASFICIIITLIYIIYSTIKNKKYYEKLTKYRMAKKELLNDYKKEKELCE